MKFKQYINEEYFTGFKSYDDYIEVFVNPSQKEIKSMGEVVRFIADNKSKKVYAFDGSDVIHSQAWKEFPNEVTKGREFNEISLLPILKELNKVHIDELEYSIRNIQREIKKGGKAFNRDVEYVNGILDQDWKWVDKYVKVSPLLNRCKKIMKKYEI